MLDFTRLRKNTKKDFSNLKPIKVAILSDSASQLLHTALKGYGYDKGLHYEIFEADYNQIEQEVFNPASAFYSFSPQVILLVKTTPKLVQQFYDCESKERVLFAERKMAELNALTTAIEQRLTAKVILFTFQEKDDRVYGNYANKLAQSFLYQVRKLNLLLMQAAQQRPNIFICDVQQLTTGAGWQNTWDAKNYFATDLVWSLDFLPTVAKNISDIVEATEGTFKKCLVVDLDNTLWGGVVGDDGMNGIEIGNLGRGKVFTQLQKWIKELKQRGIIVCVCSKNAEAIAKEPFEKHPDMVLRLEDIAVFVANWENKVDNLRFIKQTLNIGFDAMVFLDDNPFERGMVKEAIPALAVPELPQDPAEYLDYLQNLNLFETASFTAEDVHRVQLYREEAARTAWQKTYANEEDYLASLEMKAEILPLNDFTIPRAAQLSQRSNQFNLRTVRYTENDLQKIAASSLYASLVVRLKDKFGDYGIISFVVLKRAGSELFIETWLMSCRVLKRGVERLVLNHIVSVAKNWKANTIIGEYLSTPKNALVKHHYEQLGFSGSGSHWRLPIQNYVEKEAAIELINMKQNEPYIAASNFE
ncbi:HAD-IIIC family phosphatase [Flavisolibacter ginsenosidimutans]|uniref:HAD-IIIC family phosphatase n=1 Tax=Flavisolibacter ginsenosidimutans TaxID=661481 RepID=A0A5B8UEL2_9BACT|nr:HAD-IIIC family phosphatase [Flavisolibacter ginsenosidimutans]QEC54862.1 HAD-IIIC family phosphatase [Flavisolibacter ginsenosidimutans]